MMSPVYHPLPLQTVKLQPKNVTPIGMADGAAFDGAGFGGGAGGGGAEHGAAHDRVLSRAELEAMGVKELKARCQSCHHLDADASTAGGVEGRRGVEGRGRGGGRGWASPGTLGARLLVT